LRLREALVHSKNLLSLRIFQAIGFDALAQDAAGFGFNSSAWPRNDVTLALGTQEATPLEMATAYAVFANGGFKVDPYLITRIEDEQGNVVYEAQPKVVCADCETHAGLGIGQVGSDRVPEALRAPRVISAQNAWLMTDIMHDVATRGTGRRTTQLGRDDLAGKTGTTDYSRDNWFNGFTSQLVASAWVGFDDHQRSLGVSEEGSSTAVPIWMYFMGEALKGMPSSRMERPEGLIDVMIDPVSGALADPLDPNAIPEVFMADPVPETLEGVDGLEGVEGSDADTGAVTKPAPRPSGPGIF
jgi:penicillin-binding protein 1A